MAELLSEVVDYIEASQVIRINEGSDPDNSINLSVSYDEDDDKHITKVTWNNPSNNLGNVSHYVLQWRPSWEDFNYRRYQVVEFDDKGKYAVEFLPPIDGNKIYSIRIITAYDNDDEDHLPTDEVKVPSRAHYLRDLIKSHVIDVYGDSQPWLVDTWRHLNGPELALFDGTRNRVNLSSIGGSPPVAGYYPPGQLYQTIAGSLSLSQSKVDRFEYFMAVNGGRTVAHELGHVYTLTAGITKNEASVAAGYLYLELLVESNYNTQHCNPDELYAELAALAFKGTYSGFEPGYVSGGYYWGGCGFNLDQATHNDVVEDVKDVTESVFLDQEIPQWFYDRYQLDDESIDLDKLWLDVSAVGAGARGIIAYGLRNEFGGYCSREQVRQFLEGEIDSLDTPWNDAGNCPAADG